MTRADHIVISLLLGILSFISCTSDEIISPEVPDTIHSENLYLEHNKWIYAQMNRNYLWRNDLPDSLSCNYDLAPVEFFKSLLSPKDRFSYCENNSSYNPPAEGMNLGYEYQQYELSTGETFAQVLLVTNQELKGKGLKRGDVVILQPDNKKIVRGKLKQDRIVPVDTLELSYPLEEPHTVYLDSIYIMDALKIGYLCYLRFNDIKDLVPALKKFYEAHIDEMILDLRYNPGGLVSTCKYLSNSIVYEKGYNEIFQQCTYNDILTQEQISKTGSGISINRFSTPDFGNHILGSPMYGLNLKRVFVLTSKHSASASEATIISIRPFMDVVIIGEKTTGKGVGSRTIRDSKFRYQLQPIIMRYHNALMETTPDDGLDVDYYIPDGYSTSKKELGDTTEPLLSTALNLIFGAYNSNKDDIESFEVRKVNSSIKENGAPSFIRYNSNCMENEITCFENCICNNNNNR